MSLLTFDRVTMTATAGVVEILKDLTFSIDTGDFVALVGPSGSGKTSLLRLMNRLAEASSGQILWEGQNIRQLSAVSLRQQVILVNQESRLLGMTVRETLCYPLRLKRQPTAAIEATVDEWVEKMKIPTDWMDREAANLSLGQRQRVAIARALLNHPKVILLDEPTSAQDVGYSEFLLTALSTWAAQKQLAIVMANHQIELLANHATRLWHLHNGRLITDTPASEVNWAQLRQDLVTAEHQTQAEWS